MTHADDPLVTVVLPTYNRAHSIEKSLRSVLVQSYKNLEVIVVDDASTDRTEQVVMSIGDPRIRYIRHAVNRGGGAARNTGINSAKAAYVAFQDSDDEWFPEKLEKEMKVFRSAPPAVGVVYSAFIRHYRSKTEYIPGKQIKKQSGYIHKELLTTNFITSATVVARKQCLEHVGMFDEKFPRLQDWELWIRLSRHFEFYFVEEALVNVYVSDDSISMNDLALFEAQELLLVKHGRLFDMGGARVIGHHLQQLGHLHCLLGNIRAGRKYLFQSIRHSLTLKNGTTLLLTLLGRRGYRRMFAGFKSVQRMWVSASS
ncbi:MAG: glycosyltransferase family 2 protein [Trueperaceae bacterium]